MFDLEKVVFLISFSVEVWQQIITSAYEEFTEVFRNSETNSLLVLKFRSSSIFNELESEDLKQHVRNSVDFTDKFCALLKQRFDILPAINTLLNPKNSNLLNYQLKIRKIIITLLHDKIVKVDCPQNPTIGRSLAELTQLTLLKAKEFRVEFESQLPGEDTSESDPSSSSPEYQPLDPNIGATEDHVQTRSCKLSLLKGIEIAMGSIMIILFIGSFMVFGSKGGTTREREPTNYNFSSTVESSVTSLEPTVTDKISIDKVISIPSSETLKKTVADKSTRDNSGSIFQPNPPIPIKNNGILPEKNSSEPEKVKTKLVGRVVYVNSTKSMKDKTLEICDPNFDTTLIFQIFDPFSWHGFQIDCATRIKGVIFQRYTSIRNMHEILNQTINIRNLTIECDKISSRNKPLPENIPKIEFSKLKYLEVTAKNVASDCSPVFSYLGDNIQYFGKLQRLKISKVTISDDNAPEIQRIIYKMSASAPVTINLDAVMMQTSLDIRTKSQSYLGFHLFIHNVSTASVTSINFAVETIINFLSNAIYVEEFSSNAPIPDQKMSQVFKNLREVKIKKLGLKIRVKDDRDKLEFKFIQSLESLVALELELLDWRKGNASSSSLLLKNFQLPTRLLDFLVTTNFKTVSQGAAFLNCRSFNQTTNSQGGINLMLDRCLDCDDGKGECVSRRR